MNASPSELKRKQALAHILNVYQVETVLDVGAHKGEYAGGLRDHGYRGRIVSIEPVPESHAILSLRAQDDPLWHVLPPMIVSDRPGAVPFYRNAESDMSSLLEIRDEIKPLLSRSIPIESINPPVFDLRTVFDIAAIPLEKTFLKLDTQGQDLAIVKSFSRAFDVLIGVQVELALVPIYQTEPQWLEAVGVLQALGLTPILFIPGYFNQRTARLFAMDGVFVREPVPLLL